MSTIYLCCVAHKSAVPFFKFRLLFLFFAFYVSNFEWAWPCNIRGILELLMCLLVKEGVWSFLTGAFPPGRAEATNGGQAQTRCVACVRILFPASGSLAEVGADVRYSMDFLTSAFRTKMMHMGVDNVFAVEDFDYSACSVEGSCGH